MEFRFVLPFLLVIFTQTLFKSVESVNCYDCMHYEGLSDSDMGVSLQQRAKLFDDSCKNVPKSTFAIECGEDTVCTKNIIEGYLNSDKKTKVKIFERGCVASTAFKIGKKDCEQFKSFDDMWTTVEGNPVPYPFESKLSPNVAISRCTCNKDGCNTGGSSRGTTAGFWFVCLITGISIKLI